MIKIILALFLLILVIAHNIDRERDWMEEEAAWVERETDTTWDNTCCGGHKCKPDGIKRPEPPPCPPRDKSKGY